MFWNIVKMLVDSGLPVKPKMAVLHYVSLADFHCVVQNMLPKLLRLMRRWQDVFLDVSLQRIVQHRRHRRHHQYAQRASLIILHRRFPSKEFR